LYGTLRHCSGFPETIAVRQHCIALRAVGGLAVSIPMLDALAMSPCIPVYNFSRPDGVAIGSIGLHFAFVLGYDIPSATNPRSGSPQS
jgi:hypothetical protein